MSDGGMGHSAAPPDRPHRSGRPSDTPPKRARARDSNDNTDTVTVADLIAKINDYAPPPEPRRHRAPEPEPYPEADDLGDLDTVAMPVVAVPRELPRLAGPATATHRVAPPKRTHRGVLLGRSAAALIAILALTVTGSAWQWQSAKNNLLNRVSALDPDSRDIVDPNAQFGDENFLIVGVDSRFGDNLEMGAGDTDEVAGSRSDTVMLVNIPANRKRVVAVSFPRDLEITPMMCKAWNPETLEYGPIYDEETGSYGPDQVYTEYKLNSAFAVGGPKCLVKVIQKLSGLHVNRFMAVDFAGFSKMVDALGGVEVCSTLPMEDYELGTVLPVAGRQVVDGHTALNYVRARSVTTEVNGDYGRIKRQQLFLSSLLRSLISKETFFSLSKLNNVVNMFIGDSYVDNVDTKDLVNLGQSVQGVSAGRITFVTVPTVGYADEYGNEVPRADDMRALFAAIINDDPLPEERNPDDTPVPDTPESTAALGEVVDVIATDPQSVTVQVSNSTAESGLGALVANALQGYGFDVTTPDDYPDELAQTTVFYSAGYEEEAATVASSFANPTIQRISGMGDEVRVVLGTDFSSAFSSASSAGTFGSVSAPASSGSPIEVRIIRDTMSTPTQLPDDLAVTNAADTTCE
ncbi:MAG: LCP family protein [Mycolicibacterium sp.]|uniref:LCP family protein n=1 Tax=Mycolicibacterium sp. TaxID=2320850 RepID=UPI003D10962A